MLNVYTAGLDAGPRNECWAHPTSCGGGGGDGAGPGFWEKFATSTLQGPASLEV